MVKVVDFDNATNNTDVGSHVMISLSSFQTPSTFACDFIITGVLLGKIYSSQIIVRCLLCLFFLSHWRHTKHPTIFRQKKKKKDIQQTSNFYYIAVYSWKKLKVIKNTYKPNKPINTFGYTNCDYHYLLIINVCEFYLS